MSTEIQYDPSSVESHREAIIDALQFMGPAPFKMIVRAIAHGVDEYEIRLACMMVGVQGFPVNAMLHRYRMEE